tara:strand:+ start:490 stop:855 length:366 start_codon:yes stop_codon:yes gene_type:complete
MTETMTQTIELGKAEFITIEAFEFELEDGCIYEGERIEAIDTYWYEQMGCDLYDYVYELCSNNLEKDEEAVIQIIPRRWATIVDGELEDCGDSCLGQEEFIWVDGNLFTQEQYETYMKQMY